jgi:Glycoside-hydrolase family GH114
MIALVDRAPAHLLIQTLLIVIVGVWLFDTTFPSNRLLAQGNTREFGVYYGTQFDPRLSEFDLLVLDPDARLDLARLRRLAPGKQIILGYLALCELGPGRGYAAKARDAGVLLHESATWPGSFYLDIRRPEWRRMVVEEIAPAILRIGFDGLFLDTIDDAAWLETTCDRARPRHGSRREHLDDHCRPRADADMGTEGELRSPRRRIAKDTSKTAAPQALFTGLLEPGRLRRHAQDLFHPAFARASALRQYADADRRRVGISAVTALCRSADRPSSPRRP